MPHERCCEVLRNPCALTLSDEPLTSAVEHGPMQLWMPLPQLCIPLHDLVHAEVREQSARRWQSSIQQLLKHPMKWHLSLSGLGLQQPYSIGPDADKPSQVEFPLLATIPLQHE